MKLREILRETVAMYHGEGKYKGHYVFILGKVNGKNVIQFMNGTQLKGVPDSLLTNVKAPEHEA